MPLQRLQLRQKIRLNRQLTKDLVKKVWRLYDQLMALVGSTAEPPRPTFAIEKAAAEKDPEKEKEGLLESIRGTSLAIQKNFELLRTINGNVANLEASLKEKQQAIAKRKDENSKLYLEWKKCNAKLSRPTYPGEEMGQSRRIRQAYFKIKKNDAQIKELEDSINTDNKITQEKKNVAQKIRCNMNDLIQRRSELSVSYNIMK